MKTIFRYCAWLFALVIIIVINGAAIAGDLSGVVLNAETEKPVAGVNLRLEGTHYGSFTDSLGRWRIKNIPEGDYVLLVTHVAYHPVRRNVSSGPLAPLPLTIRLEPAVLLSEGVIVSFDRVRESTSTVPFTNVPRKQLTERYFGQDLPVALEGVPSLTTTTDAGNDLGYSYLSLRGYDFKRIGVFLNGVMLNDPEDFYVYWVDLADFGANVEDVQVQRGVGSVPYGLPSVGGTISVRTRIIEPSPEVSAEYGYGSYNTRRASFHLASGPLKNGLYLNARFSKISSDGYRDQSWADYFSYYLAAERIGEKTTTRLVLFGGPIRNHMAYVGATPEQLAENRRANPLDYKNETDNYYQPHYQLQHTWNINDNLELAQTLYYIHGEGYFEVKYPWDWYTSWDFWDLPQLTVADSTLYQREWYRADSTGSLAVTPDGRYYVDYTDAVALQHVDNDQVGWQPRLTWKTAGHELSLGGQVVSHKSRRYGELLWAAALPEGTDPRHIWYDYSGGKRIINGYLRDIYTPTKRFSITAAVQLASIRYTVNDDKRFGVNLNEDYFFAMPHLGASFKVSDPVRMWGSYSLVEREPRLKDHYWGETGYPVIRYDNPVLYEGRQIDPETLHDFETGVDWTGSRMAFRANLYWMEMYNEIVDIGEYDVTGQPIIENADHSRRVGMELSARVLLPHNLYFEGNLNLARNRFVEYRTQTSVIDSSYNLLNSPVELDNSGNRIIMAPERILNLAAGWRGSLGWFRVSMHNVAERYLDNTENMKGLPDTVPGTSFDPKLSPTASVDRRLDGYTRVDLSFALNLVGENARTGLIHGAGFPAVEWSFHLLNLLDADYMLSGSTDAWGVYLIPAAPLHFMTGVKVTL